MEITWRKDPKKMAKFGKNSAKFCEETKSAINVAAVGDIHLRDFSPRSDARFRRQDRNLTSLRHQRGTENHDEAGEGERVQV